MTAHCDTAIPRAPGNEMSDEAKMLARLAAKASMEAGARRMGAGDVGQSPRKRKDRRRRPRRNPDVRQGSRADMTKRFRAVAGPNGSGKSTLADSAEDAASPLKDSP